MMSCWDKSECLAQGLSYLCKRVSIVPIAGRQPWSHVDARFKDIGHDKRREYLAMSFPRNRLLQIVIPERCYRESMPRLQEIPA